jgi:hypothetical protein
MHRIKRIFRPSNHLIIRSSNHPTFQSPNCHRQRLVRAKATRFGNDRQAGEKAAQQHAPGDTWLGFAA